MSLLSSSSVGSELAVASVDHGGKAVDAAAVLLWALVADRYSMVQHILMLHYIEERYMLCMRVESWHRDSKSFRVPWV